MALIKISQLPLATSPLDSTVEMPVVQGGATKRAGMTTIGFLQSGTGAVLRTAQNKMREIISVKDFGAVGDSVADDTAAINTAIAATPSGAALFFAPGNYRITSTLFIPRPMSLEATPGSAQLSMGTTNTDHIRIGDGTLTTRNNSLNVSIVGLTFAPAAGVTAFTSGACIRVQYGAFVTLEKCDFFGSDGARKLWNGIEFDRCEDSWVMDCRARQFLNSGFYAYGAAGVSNRTVDIKINNLRTSDIDGDHVYFGPHSQGMFLTDWVAIGVVANKSGLRINADPVTEQGTNYFLINPNVEGGNAASSNGVYVEKGQAVDITGGWFGGFTPATANGIWFGSGSSSCMANGVRVEGGGGVRMDGAACSLNGSEVSGETGVTTACVSIGSGAQGFSVVGGRIRIATTAGIAIAGTPADGVISSVTFANVTGDTYITGAAYAGGPAVSGLRSQASKFATAAATVPIRYGVPVYQITGATTISNFTLLAPGAELNVQAGAGGITVNNAGNVVLKGAAASITIAAFSARKFVCDGSNWFEV